MAESNRQQPRRSCSEAVALLFSAGDPGMKDVHVLMEQVAETDITLLIRGESGTGKDLDGEVGITDLLLLLANWTA